MVVRIQFMIRLTSHGLGVDENFQSDMTMLTRGPLLSIEIQVVIFEIEQGGDILQVSG